MRHEIRTEIDIEAPPAQIWAHLVDLPAWADWNPFITSSEGTLAVGELGLPGLFDGRHRFELTETESGTQLVQREWFSGVLVRPLRRWLDGSTRAGFEAMNDALRRRVAAAMR